MQRKQTKNNQTKKSLREVFFNLKSQIRNFFYRLYYIFRIVWETRPWILVLMIFMAFFNGIAPVISAFINARLLNALLKAFNASINGLNNEFKLVMTFLILQFGFMFLDDFINSINRILIRISNELVGNQVNLKIMHKAKTIDLASFDSPEFYEKFENASREASNRPIQVTNATFSIISTLISVVSFVTVLTAISYFAPIIIIILSIPSAIINFVYRRKNFQYVRRRSKQRRQMNYYSSLMTNKDIIKEIKMFNLADSFIARYQKTYLQYFQGLRKLITVEGAWMILITIITTIVHGGMFLFIAREVSYGRLEIGAYALYTGALKSIAGGISSLISTTGSIYEGTLFIDNMIEFMSEKQTIKAVNHPARKVLRHHPHQIVFDKVYFRYPGSNHDVIKNLSLTINSQDTVVLVGLNGAGKTTLIKLLTRLYDPTSGNIYLDGHDIREYDVNSLYQIFGIIFQDFGKYAVTVEENIGFGEIEKPFDISQIEKAAFQSSAQDFIKHFDKGYQTPLMRIFDDHGEELSTGQWQKIAIARAFYKDSDILILDEPTAALDAIAEQEIYDQFDTLRKGKMTIFVSHRLSSATIASKIFVLQAGHLIEEGNHQSLMADQGHYWKLFTTQAERYLTLDE